MQIIVTGGAGFIGSHLVRSLVHDNHCVLNIDKLTYAGDLKRLIDIPHRVWTKNRSDEANHWFAQLDLCNYTAVSSAIQAFRPEAIFHLAAETHVDRSIEGPSPFVISNVVGTASLLEASLKYWKMVRPEDQARFRFVHISTDEVFGSLDETGYFTEKSAYDPRSPYSATKAASDHLVRAYRYTYDLPSIVTNCCNNFGPGQHREKLIPTVVHCCLEEKSIPVYGNGLNVREWLFVTEHCDALKSILVRGSVGEKYNIGSGNELRNIDLVHRVCNLMDELRPRTSGTTYRDLITSVSDRPGHDWRYAMNSDKIRQQTQWQATQSFDVALRKTVESFITQ